MSLDDKERGQVTNESQALLESGNFPQRLWTESEIAQLIHVLAAQVRVSMRDSSRTLASKTPPILATVLAPEPGQNFDRLRSVSHLVLL